MFSTRRILVTGTTEVVGSRVAAALAANGDTVFGLCGTERAAELVRRLGATPVAADPRDRAQVIRAIGKARPDVVIHQLTGLPTTPLTALPAGASADRHRLRRDGTHNLAAAAEQCGVQRLVVRSVAFAYRPQGPWIVDERAPLDTDAPGTWGQIVSAAAEVEEAALAGRNYVGVVLRYGALYGPDTPISHNADVARLLRRRRLPVIRGGEGRQSFIHVDDAAGATLAALEYAAGIYNVVDDRPAAGGEWIPAAAEALGAPPPRELPAWAARLLVGQHAVRVLTLQRGVSNARIRELGWKPEYADWRAGFADLGTTDGSACP